MVTLAGVAADLGHSEVQCALEGFVAEVGYLPIGYFVECRDTLFMTNEG